MGRTEEEMKVTAKCASIASSDHGTGDGLRRVGKGLYVCERHDVRIFGCHVYAIVAGELGRVKIGSTHYSVKDRMGILQVASPCRLEILRYSHANHLDERKLQKLLRPFHVTGGWFALNPESGRIIFRYVDELDKEYPDSECRYDVTPQNPRAAKFDFTDGVLARGRELYDSLGGNDDGSVEVKLSDGSALTVNRSAFEATMTGTVEAVKLLILEVERLTSVIEDAAESAAAGMKVNVDFRRRIHKLETRGFWISTKCELPKLGAPVLLLTDPRGSYGRAMAQRVKNLPDGVTPEWYWSLHWLETDSEGFVPGVLYDFQVTHWQPMPEPPK